MVNGVLFIFNPIFIYVFSSASRCNAYNVSTASACLLAVAFCVSLFYDVQDLFASKQSPRTRG
jgi:hypothetical protein